LVRRVGRKLMMTGELIDVSADGEPVLVRATATMIAIDMVDLGGLSAELPPPEEADGLPDDGWGASVSRGAGR
ncbi:MAG: hypothetical protein M3501_08905, partial [Actinomycetota bacterium]|nr:hypothetical protein [Actinomycetota bacterium]